MLTALACFYEVTTTCVELIKTQVEPDLEEDMSEEEFLSRLKACKGTIIYDNNEKEN